VSTALGKYNSGQTTDAIIDLESRLDSLNYDADKLSFIQTARLLLYLYWRTEDPASIHTIRARLGGLLVAHQPLDDLDRSLAAYVESYRVREAFLSRDLQGARQYALPLLEIFQSAGGSFQFRAARVDLLLTLAMISRAELRLAEADSYMQQALALALSDKTFWGIDALDFLESLVRHYMESGQFQYAELVTSRLLSAPTWFKNLSDRSVLGFSLALLLAELAVQRVTPETAEPLVNLFAYLEQTEGQIERLPRRMKVEIYAALLYIQLVRREAASAAHTFSLLETFYGADEGKEKGIANVLAWSALALGRPDTATQYVAAGRSEPSEINIFLYPLNRLVQASLDRLAGRSQEALRNTEEAFSALLKNIAGRGFAAPTTSITLSFVEHALLADLLTRALEFTSSGNGTPLLTEEMSLALQLLQRDRFPRGALFSPGFLAASTANLEEHLRAREQLAQSRYRAVANVVDRLVERVARTTNDPNANAFEFGEMNRFFEYTYRINALDAYLQSPLYTQVDFIARRLALADPKKVQGVLRSDEALIAHALLPPDRLVIECVTRDMVQFSSVSVDPKTFDLDVRLLNLSLAATYSAAPGQFAASSAVAIFRTLFAPAAACLHGKSQLIIATEPALLGIPFNALLTAMPAVSPDGYDLRNAPWMIRQWALSVAPAQATLVHQRSRPSLARPRKSLLGFGNPRFEGPTAAARFVDPHVVYDVRGAARADGLRSLPALPETETELRRIRASVGGSDSLLFFGEDATERNVRSQDLDDYKIVVFATHGLTAGEFDLLAEPALALTPGSTPDSRNDGLLRMSEISRLWIAADFVVLSACNTAAGDGTPSATGFSGLVNAFFFAGARAVLASQWPVASKMAEALTTGMFSAAASRPGMPLSVALQRAMLTIIDGSGDPAYVHPRFWAPFLVAGESPSAIPTDSASGLTKPRLVTRWEQNFGEKFAGEILGVASDTDGTVYATGLTEPKGGRAQSIVLATDGAGKERWRVEDPVIGGAPHLLPYAKNRIATDGSLWSKEKFAGAVLRGFDRRNGAELWRTVVDSPEHDHSIGLLPSAGDNLLWIVGSYADGAPSSAVTVSLLTVDPEGSVIATRHGELHGEGFPFWTSATITRWQGHLLLALSFTKSVQDMQQLFAKDSRDLMSGYSMPCGIKHVTRLVLLEESTAQVVGEKTIDGMELKGFGLTPDGRLLASVTIWETCLGYSDAAVVEVAADLSIQTKFRYGGPLEKSAGHITVLPDGKVVLVGYVTLAFDLAPYVRRNVSDPIEIPSVQFTGEFLTFDDDRRTFSAFVVLLDANGNFLADRMIRDLRGRIMRAAATRHDGTIVFGGLANGVSSWLGVIDAK
jgi:CHAT domain-containing protein